ncbi:MAG: type II secretion system F family protein [Eubacterium sp.]|nr:type II secretion system F family protein [Eubacterium sp.]
MDYRKYDAGKAERIMLMIILTAFLAAVGILFYNTVLTCALSVILYIPACRIYSRVMADRRRKELRDQFRDLLDSLAASFAGGRHMQEALSEAEKELSAIYEDDEVIMTEIRGMLKRMGEGENDEHVMDDLAARSGIEDIEVFSDVFSACRETGGDMITAMTDASSMLGDKIKIENEIRAITAQKKTEGVMISIMPAAIILFLRLIAPDYIEVLYGDLTGAVLMTAALAATIYSYHLIRKITEIEV